MSFKHIVFLTNLTPRWCPLVNATVQINKGRKVASRTPLRKETNFFPVISLAADFIQ